MVWKTLLKSLISKSVQVAKAIENSKKDIALAEVYQHQEVIIS